MGQVTTREVKVFAGSSLSGTPQNFGSDLEIPGYRFSIINASSKNVLIADGTGQDDIYLPAGSTLSNGEGFAQEGKSLNVQASFRIGTQLTIESSDGAAGTGTIVAFIWS